MELNNFLFIDINIKILSSLTQYFYVCGYKLFYVVNVVVVFSFICFLETSFRSRTSSICWRITSPTNTLFMICVSFSLDSMSSVQRLFCHLSCFGPRKTGLFICNCNQRKLNLCVEMFVVQFERKCFEHIAILIDDFIKSMPGRNYIYKLSHLRYICYVPSTCRFHILGIFQEQQKSNKKLCKFLHSKEEKQQQHSSSK